VILAGGKTLIKTVQSLLPVTIGLIPLPYTSMVGIAMAALLGFIVWPIFAIISLSRQDFVAAVESYIRMIPSPIGDMLANTFLEGNRAVAKIDEKRIKLGNDISAGLTQISQLATSATSSMKEGLTDLARQTREAASTAQKSMPTMPEMPEMQTQYQQATIPVAPGPAPTSALERLRSQKTAFKAPTLRKGGFHRRTRRKAWRTKKTRRTSARR
jgi:hypothetical protein